MARWTGMTPMSLSPYETGMKVLDATWVEARKPDGAVRCHYCVREFKIGDPRTKDRCLCCGIKHLYVKAG